MADSEGRIFCENPEENKFSAKISQKNFRRKFVTPTLPMERPDV